MHNKKTLRILIGALITIVFLVLFALKFDYSALLTSYKSIPHRSFVIAFMFHLSTYLLRSLNLKLILENHNIKFLEICCAHFIHNMYVHIIPASLGELSLPVLLKKKVSTQQSFLALLTIRLTMVFMILLITFISLFFIDNTAFTQKLRLIIIIAFALVIFAIVIFHKTGQKIQQTINTKKPSRLINIFNKLTEALNSQQHIFNNPWLLIRLLLIVLLTWLSQAMFFKTILATQNIEFSLFEIAVCTSIGIFINIIPIKSFGGFGMVEGAWTTSIVILGYTVAKGVEASTILHIITLQNVFIIAGIGFLFNLIVKSKKHG